MNPIPVVERLWDAWDVRAMILLSLLLQIILFMLGNGRKSTVTPWVGILLWIAYLSADWVATAALGKLSSACYLESGPSNFLRGLWASLLLLHLGGPDTITAYSLEDNLLWKRHLLGLGIQTTLAIYVIVYSWTRSLFSLLNLPMFLAGIIKYIERTWSLYSDSCKDSKKPPPLSDENFRENWESYVDAEKIIALAHQWFTLMRPDLKNYFSITGNLRSIGAKLMGNVQDMINQADIASASYVRYGSKVGCIFDFAAIELGFMFDMLYTKSAIIYTKLGCILRLISFFCSLFVLVFFLLCFKSPQNPHDQQYWSSVDICITQILLAGAVALELYGLFLIISSDWFELVIIRSFRKGKVAKIIEMIGIDEMLHKYRQTSFTDIPKCLKEDKLFPFTAETIMSMVDTHLSPRFTRGEKALEKHDCRDETVKNTLLLDLGATIMIWHIATDICHHRLKSATTENENADTCKKISDYMMYVLVMKPSMVYEDDNFWFGSLDRKLRELLRHPDNDISLDDEAKIYQQLLDKISSDEVSNMPAMEVLQNAIKVAQILCSRPDTWDVMMSVWIEMMHYAAICSPHLSHLQHLSKGSEILSIYCLITVSNIFSL